MVEHLHGKEFINWIQCTSCHSWYHDACVGISTDTLPDTFVFSCCSSSFHQQNSSMLVNVSKAVPKPIAILQIGKQRPATSKIT